MNQTLANFSPLLSETSLVQSGLFLLGIATLFYVLQLLLITKTWFRKVASVAMLLAAIVFTVALVERSLVAQYVALTNMYEALIITAIVFIAAFLVVEGWFKVTTLGWAASTFALMVVFFAGSLPTEINPLQPALQSYWRFIHVPMILISYSLFTVAAFSSAAYLIVSSGKVESALPMAASGQDATSSNNPNAGDTTSMISYHTKVNLYDEVSYRCIAAGVPFLTVGIILGAIWANEAWGNYWSWDPKESMSLVTLLVYGVYLHMRINGGHTKKTLALVSSLGFFVMFITYVGVNLWSTEWGMGSMHTYGKPDA